MAFQAKWWILVGFPWTRCLVPSLGRWNTTTSGVATHRSSEGAYQQWTAPWRLHNVTSSNRNLLGICSSLCLLWQSDAICLENQAFSCQAFSGFDAVQSSLLLLSLERLWEAMPEPWQTYVHMMLHMFFPVWPSKWLQGEASKHSKSGEWTKVFGLSTTMTLWFPTIRYPSNIDTIRTNSGYGLVIIFIWLLAKNKQIHYNVRKTHCHVVHHMINHQLGTCDDPTKATVSDVPIHRSSFVAWCYEVQVLSLASDGSWCLIVEMMVSMMIDSPSPADSQKGHAVLNGELWVSRLSSPPHWVVTMTVPLLLLILFSNTGYW